MTIHATPSTYLAIMIAFLALASFRICALSSGFSHTPSSSTMFKTAWGSSSKHIRSFDFPRYRNQHSTTTLPQSIGGIEPTPLCDTTTLPQSIGGIEPTPLCDLQTFLRLCNLVDSGGEAKTVIQDSKCVLNGIIETRRGKKLYAGDKVSYLNTKDLDVATVVEEKEYVYKLKVKKDKPLPKVDEEGNIEFGGRYRSEEWREERKMKKAERKIKNQKSR